jgi:hypothetical protein
VQSIKQWAESKDQRKARKQSEKSNKMVQEIVPSSFVEKRYVLCLKWGDKYSAEYVNILYNMVNRNLTIDYEFICFTENSKGIDKHITVKPLPKISVTGWWYKPWFLSNELGITGTALFLDLDLIVFRNIDHLFEYNLESDFVIIRDFNRIARKGWDRMNSSVFRFKIGKYNNLYQDFKINHAGIVRKFQGDQDWMYKTIKDYTFWPDTWIQSYKWEMRGREHLGVVNGQRNFKTAGIPKLDVENKIAVFHGHPNIHDCVDTWPKENWK